MKHWKLSEYFQYVSTDRVLLQRIFFSLALLSLAVDYWQGMMLSGIGANPVLNQDVDPVYLLFMLTKIPQFLSGPFAPYFDSLLIIFCLACIVWPSQQICPGLFLLSYFVYFVVSNMLSGHHYTNIGVLVMSVPFIFRSEQRFTTAFAAIRFFLCFMMFSAACWKIARGNLWHIEQTQVMLMTSYAEQLAAGNAEQLVTGNAAQLVPGNAQAFTTLNKGWLGFVQWLIDHATLAHLIWIILIALEFLFVLGFVSFKWDRLLLIAYLLFFVGGWIIFKIYNFENLLLLLTLCPVLNFIAGFRLGPQVKTI